MAIPITATIQGHPWDLWGLSKLFDGTDATHTHVDTQKPEGRPSFDPTDLQAVARFRAVGYDISATLTSDELVWSDAGLRPDLRDMREPAASLLARVNGIGHFLDPLFRSAKLQFLSYQTENGTGSMPLSDWEPNRSDTYLGRQFQLAFAQDVLNLSASDTRIQFVLNAIALPRTWASLYLVFEAIATDVDGQHNLLKMGWISPEEKNEFTKAANNSRTFSEEIRHATTPPRLPTPLISLDQAYFIITKLMWGWLDSKR